MCLPSIVCCGLRIGFYIRIVVASVGSVHRSPPEYTLSFVKCTGNFQYADIAISIRVNMFTLAVPKRCVLYTCAVCATDYLTLASIYRML